MEYQEFIEFMLNPANAHKCDKCPENRKEDGWQDRLSCGQWHCWVTLHCRKDGD